MTKTDYVSASLLDVPFGEWARVLELPEKEAYRARQVQEWVFARRAKTFAEMTTLPAALRQKFDGLFTLRALTLQSRETSALDGTERLFFKTGDGKTVSAVFLPGRPAEKSARGAAASPESSAAGPAEKSARGAAASPESAAAGPADAADPKGSAEGEDADEDEPGRFSLCLSTQVGCAWGCVFCASGLVKFQRNLLPSEILDQVFLAEEATGKKVSSLLFMGMGEPLANYNNLLWALRCLRAPVGFNYGARHVTVSTSGLVPQIFKLSEESPKVNLAISLHAADDETRAKILPKSSNWPIKDLLKAAWAYQKNQGNVRVTFEYILLKGINDSLRSAQRLSNLLRGRNAWVNLIAYNPVAGLPYKKPDPAAVAQFEKVLSSRGIFVRVRKPQGVDISAGCGQLGEAVRSRKN